MTAEETEDGRWTRLGESAKLLREMIAVIFSAKRPAPSDADTDRVKRLRVSELRQELSDAGLDTDGARDDLEERLRETAAGRG